MRLVHTDRVYGLVSVGVRREYVRDSDEHALFKELAGDLAFSLHDMELDERRKRAERAHRGSESRFRNIFDRSPIGIELYDSTSFLINANKACLDIFGVGDVAEAKRFNLLETPSLSDDLKARLKLGETVSYEVVIDVEKVKRPHLYRTSKSGTICLSVWATPLGRAGKGIWHGYLVQVEDVTMRKQAEEEIRSLAKFPSEDPHPVLRLSGDGVVIYANAASGPLLRHWGCKIGSTAPEFCRDSVAWALESGSSSILEAPCGETLYSFVVAPIADSGYVNLYGIDITERKRLEEQFLHAQRMEAVGRLAGGVAHDFNNLLTGIKGYAQIVAHEAEGDSPAAHYLDQINTLTDRAAALTRQLLAFSRRQVLQESVINMNKLIDNMVKMLRRVMGEDIDLQFIGTLGLGDIKADPGQIEQVLMNLVVNARDAMPDGGKLTIRTENVTLTSHCAQVHAGAKPGLYVQLTVADTGGGMDESMLQRIFDPFFTTKERGKGTGLGLAAVYGIVKQHGGHIEVSSEPEAGTVFKIYLPRVDVAPASTRRTMVESRTDIRRDRPD